MPDRMIRMVNLPFHYTKENLTDLLIYIVGSLSHIKAIYLRNDQNLNLKYAYVIFTSERFNGAVQRFYNEYKLGGFSLTVEIIDPYLETFQKFSQNTYGVVPLINEKEKYFTEKPNNWKRKIEVKESTSGSDLVDYPRQYQKTNQNITRNEHPIQQRNANQRIQNRNHKVQRAVQDTILDRATINQNRNQNIIRNEHPIQRNANQDSQNRNHNIQRVVQRQILDKVRTRQNQSNLALNPVNNFQETAQIPANVYSNVPGVGNNTIQKPVGNTFAIHPINNVQAKNMIRSQGNNMIKNPNLPRNSNMNQSLDTNWVVQKTTLTNQQNQKIQKIKNTYQNNKETTNLDNQCGGSGIKMQYQISAKREPTPKRKDEGTTKEYKNQVHLQNMVRHNTSTLKDKYNNSLGNSKTASSFQNIKPNSVEKDAPGDKYNSLKKSTNEDMKLKKQQEAKRNTSFRRSFDAEPKGANITPSAPPIEKIASSYPGLERYIRESQQGSTHADLDAKIIAKTGQRKTPPKKNYQSLYPNLEPHQNIEITEFIPKRNFFSSLYPNLANIAIETGVEVKPVQKQKPLKRDDKSCVIQ